MVDLASFAHIQLILDNLLNREAEPEDAILAASTTLKQLIASAQQQTPSSDWESELDELHVRAAGNQPHYTTRLSIPAPSDGPSLPIHRHCNDSSTYFSLACH